MSSESAPAESSSPLQQGGTPTASGSPSLPSQGSPLPQSRLSSAGGFVLSAGVISLIVAAVVKGFIPREDWRWALGGIVTAALPVSVVERLGMKLIEKLPTFGGGKS